MAVEYSVDTCRELARLFREARLHRPLGVERYEPGARLAYQVTGVWPARPARVKLSVQEFVGGGFAGQVYRVKLLHEIGAHEPARQYEWWTCKSQPNVLKRLDSEGDPKGGLTAVDFRPGLALLPFLPMSPGDVPLIFKGLARGSCVQFDRGDLKALRRYTGTRRAAFADMAGALESLEELERIYRDSLPDITHNHVSPNGAAADADIGRGAKGPEGPILARRAMRGGGRGTLRAD